MELSLVKWRNLSRDKQLLNIAAELSRAKNWLKAKDYPLSKICLKRALELIDLSVEVRKNSYGLKELLRFRGVLADFYINKEKGCSRFINLCKVFLDFSPIGHNLEF
ncbi:MAG: hypothetical protein KAS87_03075 [Candidatus Omnitrophica bacterium]|nr:hypothetical protein [Candidatus Omnitrophota bacterium]